MNKNITMHSKTPIPVLEIKHADIVNPFSTMSRFSILTVLTIWRFYTVSETHVGD
ncbi:hypothetical protein E2C01_030263 [Portunus trituberculatus]|uniref:Uncharacterized protein n=1 Tax=Portunus trituberculatus TaxID=210409 RepID=A0A5B7EWU4_PORTR|nr:hypothetical protein [Portunus trituberculatus]